MSTLGIHTGQLIKSRRRELGLSQMTLSKMMGWPKKNGQHISNCERGLNPFPRKHVNSLSSALSMSRDVIIDAMVRDYKEMVDGTVKK